MIVEQFIRGHLSRPVTIVAYSPICRSAEVELRCGSAAGVRKMNRLWDGISALARVEHIPRVGPATFRAIRCMTESFDTT